MGILDFFFSRRASQSSDSSSGSSDSGSPSVADSNGDGEYSDLALWIMNDVEKHTSCPLGEVARQRIAEIAIQCGSELATKGITTVDLPFVAADASGPKHYKRSFTQQDVDAARH